MEVHQTEFLHAVALAGVVALSMTGWEKGREETRVQAGGTPALAAGTQYTAVKKSNIAVATRKVEVQR